MSDIERLGLDLPALEAWAAAFGGWLAARLGPERPVLTVGLVGELGAGKTTLTRALVGALPGGDPRWVTSPTYAIVQPYSTQPPVRHADLYRLEGEDELDAIGYAEMMAEPGINLVEWIGRVPGAAPAEWLELRLVATADDVRDIRVRAHGPALHGLLRTEPCP